MAEPIRIISSMATRQLLTELLAAFARESSQAIDDPGDNRCGNAH